MGLSALFILCAAPGVSAADGDVVWREVAEFPAAGIGWNASAVQSDGRTLIVGTATVVDVACGGERRLLTVARLRADGALDTGFGAAATPGFAVVPSACGERLRMPGIAVGASGRIVLAGSRLLDDGREFPTVIAMLANGALDPAFGAMGIATWVLPTPNDQRRSVNAVVVEPVAPFRIYVGGTAALQPGSSEARAALLYALNADGTHRDWGSEVASDGRRHRLEAFPRTFRVCSAAIMELAFGSGDGLRALARVDCLPDPDATPVLLLQSRSADAPATRHPFTFAATPALDAEGFLPPGHTFRALRFGADPTASRSWVVAGDLRLAPGAAVPRIGVAALDALGRLDTGVLSGQGRTTIAPLDGFSATAIALQADGKPVVAGFQTSGILAGALRLRPDSGAVDLSFAGATGGIGYFGFSGMDASEVYGLHRVPNTGDLVATGQAIPFDPIFARAFGAARIRADAVRVFTDGFEAPASPRID